MTFNRGISIDGHYFDIPMVSLKRTADVLDKYAERTEDGVLHRELIGVYYNYTLNVGSSTAFGNDDYDILWDKLTEPVPFHEISLPVKNGTYTFTGYISSVSDEYSKIGKEDAEFKGLTCRFIAERPARVPG